VLVPDFGVVGDHVVIWGIAVLDEVFTDLSDGGCGGGHWWVPLGLFVCFLFGVYRPVIRIDVGECRKTFDLGGEWVNWGVFG